MKKHVMTMKEQLEDFRWICETQHFIYSPQQAAKELEIDFESLKKWSFSDENKSRRPQVDMHRCRYYCALNIGRAFCKGELTEKKAFKHLDVLEYGRKWSMIDFEADTLLGELNRRANIMDAKKNPKTE